MTTGTGERKWAGWLVGMALVGLLGVGCASVDPMQPLPRQGTGRYEPLPAGGIDQVRHPSAGPVVLLFQSPRCPYCKAVMRSVRSGVAEGKPWVVYTVDVAQEPALRAELGVGPVPCLIYFRNGQEIDRSTGWRPGFSLNGKFDHFFR